MTSFKYILLSVFLISSLHAFSQNHAKKIGLSVGDIAPNISLPNTDGDTIDLYDLRGKLVLVDFWASWCGPCLAENPNLVLQYNTFKDSTFTVGKGFDIFSVSLDVDKKYWLNVIERHKLNWPHQASDLLGWYSPVVSLYNVKAIPNSMLIDESGVIISKGIRGARLGELLHKYVIPTPTSSVIVTKKKCFIIDALCRLLKRE